LSFGDDAPAPTSSSGRGERLGFGTTTSSADGTANTFFTTNGASLSQFDSFRLRYKAFLTDQRIGDTGALVGQRRFVDPGRRPSPSQRRAAPSAAPLTSRRR
jgi:hypothetical protein